MEKNNIAEILKRNGLTGMDIGRSRYLVKHTRTAQEARNILEAVARLLADFNTTPGKSLDASLARLGDARAILAEVLR